MCGKMSLAEVSVAVEPAARRYKMSEAVAVSDGSELSVLALVSDHCARS